MTPRDRIVLVVLGIMVLLAGAWFGAVAPRRAEAGDLHQQVAAARQQRDTAVQQAAAGLAAQRTFAENRTAVAQLGKAVPGSDDTASLLYELQAAAGRSRVTFTGITPAAAAIPPAPAAPVVPPSSTTPSPPATATPAPGAAGASLFPAGVTAVPISLTFQGTYPDLERFLRRVHTFTTIRGQAIRVRGRLISVQAIQLSTTDPSAKRVHATVSAATYTATDPIAATPGAGSVPAPASGVSAAPPVTTAGITVGR